MKKTLFLFLVLISIVSCSSGQNNQSYCLTGAFLADAPSKEDIIAFKDAFGKKPYLVMVFLDWGGFLDNKTINEVYGEGSLLAVTWEPWEAESKEGIDFDSLVLGKFDQYIKEFALQIKSIKQPVFLRFAHEPNGNWYPWAGEKIGKDKYVAVYRHIHDIFKQAEVKNVKWVFCLNWEDVPKENNNFLIYYPGDSYVDYVGLDGYNWGNTQSWSRWMGFKEIFIKRYKEAVEAFNKPVLIAEFSSVSVKGDKALWIKEALSEIKKMDMVRGFVLFNIDKEGDWKFKQDTPAAIALKEALKDSYFKDQQ